MYKIDRQPPNKILLKGYLICESIAVQKLLAQFFIGIFLMKCEPKSVKKYNFSL